MTYDLRLPSLFLLLFCLACGVEQSELDDEPINLFFDIEQYFNDQIKELNVAQPKLTKIVRIGGKEEKKEFEKVDFEKELQVFRRSDINRPAWSDKYQVDSTLEGGQLLTIQYVALDTSLNTRLLEVNFSEGTVKSIRIQNRSHSAIASSAQDLLYQPGRSYYIESRQKTIGSDWKQVEVEVEF